MPRRRWPPILAAVGLVIGAYSHPAAFAQNRSSDASKSNPQRAAPEQSPITKVDIARIAKALEAANVKQQTAKEKKDAADYLQSQKDMATFAGRMLIVASIEAAITLVGVILVGLTLKAARSSAREAKRAADEAKRQADAAEKQLTTLERPHVFIDNIRIETQIRASWANADPAAIARGRIAFKYDIMNWGRSPAIIKETRGGVYIGTDLPLFPTPNPNDVWTDEIVVPANDKRPDFILFHRATLTPGLIASLFDGRGPKIDDSPRTRCFVYVQVTYESVQGLTDEVGVISEFLVDINRLVPLKMENYTYRKLGS